jgi:hypothetical protein
VDLGVAHGRRVAPERRLAGQELVGDDAQGVGVAIDVAVYTGERLWRHVLGGADDGPGPGQARLLSRSGDPEIDQCDVIVRPHHDVAWLDVSVDHPVAMGVVQGAGKLPEQPHRPIHRQWCRRPDDLAQGAAFQQVHDDVVEIVLLGDVVDQDDVGVAQPGRDHRLAPEPLDDVRLVRQVRAQDFDGPGLLQRLVHTPVDGAHAAAAEPGDQLIMSQDPSEHLIHRRWA